MATKFTALLSVKMAGKAPYTHRQTYSSVPCGLSTPASIVSGRCRTSSSVWPPPSSTISIQAMFAILPDSRRNAGKRSKEMAVKDRGFCMQGNQCLGRFVILRRIVASGPLFFFPGARPMGGKRKGSDILAYCYTATCYNCLEKPLYASQRS